MGGLQVDDGRRQFDTVNREDEDGTNLIATYLTPRTSRTTSWYQEFAVGAARRSTGSVA
jgi:hypothetical protein